MKTALLVDLGNVLVSFDHAITVRRIAEASGQPPEDIASVLYSDLEIALDEGRLSPQEFFREAERRAGLPRLPDEIWRPAWSDIFEPIPEAIEALHAVRKDVRKVLVSNTNALHWEGVLRVAPIKDYFDTLVLSHEAGCRKPSPRFFETALLCAGARPKDALFVDDKIEFVNAAASCGIESFQITEPGSLRRILLKTGIIPSNVEGMPRGE